MEKSGTICEICVWRRSDVSTINFQHISHIALVFPIGNFEQLNLVGMIVCHFIFFLPKLEGYVFDKKVLKLIEN